MTKPSSKDSLSPRAVGEVFSIFIYFFPGSRRRKLLAMTMKGRYCKSISNEAIPFHRHCECPQPPSAAFIGKELKFFGRNNVTKPSSKDSLSPRAAGEVFSIFIYFFPGSRRLTARNDDLNRFAFRLATTIVGELPHPIERVYHAHVASS